MITAIDLSGEWKYRTDPEDTDIRDKIYAEVWKLGGSFTLPGSACENGVGTRQEFYETMTKETVRAPKERFEYLGTLWLRREIIVPEEFAGKAVRLFLERVNMSSALWLDGEPVGRQIIELSAPHIYDLTGRLTPGEHHITLRLDNRDLLCIDKMSSGYSADTQGYWNGVIGTIELQAEEICHIEDVQVYPDEGGVRVKVTATADVHTPSVYQDGYIVLSVAAPEGTALPEKRFSVKLYNAKQVEYFYYEIENAALWDEFSPALYTLTIRYVCGDTEDKKSVRFGIRTVENRNKQLRLNGRQLSLRGTTDCAIFPLTGYPPMDTQSWRHSFETVKSYGLNLVRFHAWCPPEAAFRAADELGLYLYVEMPLWINRDVCALELGEDSMHRVYFMQEALTISKTYGSHPSFLLFSCGNENMGDFSLLNDIVTCVKAYDSRRLYTLTSNFDHPVLPCEDFLCAFEAGGNRVRIQTMQDKAAEDTCLNYTKAAADTPAPVISFEVGQYCVYPNVDLAESYTGNMLPVNLDVIRKHMKTKGVYHKLKAYIKASGALAVKLYKEDIEAALRTKGFGGFELLSLCDHTGQCTATVGILDAFQNSKGLITPGQFRAFCGPVVPLFLAKRIFTNDETLDAQLALYDFGEHPIQTPEYEVSIYCGTALFYHCKTQENKLRVPFGGIKRSSQLRVTVRVREYENEWRIFVFAPCKERKEVRYIRTHTELREIAETGGRAIVTRDCF